MAQTADPYATLKIAPDADVEVVKAAYRALMLKYHPDQNRDDPAALAQARRINAAYEVLGDPARRAAHDAAQASADLGHPPPPYAPFDDGPASASDSAAARRGFRLPGVGGVVVAALAWRAAGVAAALVVVAGGGFYLQHRLSAMGLGAAQSFSSVGQAIDGAGGASLVPAAAPAPVAPHIIHIDPANPSGARPAGYSRHTEGGVTVYRRDDPWTWLRVQYWRLKRGWRRPAAG